VQFAA